MPFAGCFSADLCTGGAQCCGVPRRRASWVVAAPHDWLCNRAILSLLCQLNVAVRASRLVLQSRRSCSNEKYCTHSGFSVGHAFRSSNSSLATLARFCFFFDRRLGVLGEAEPGRQWHLHRNPCELVGTAASQPAVRELAAWQRDTVCEGSPCAAFALPDAWPLAACCWSGPATSSPRLGSAGR